MGRIQRLTKLILVSTKSSMSSNVSGKTNLRRRHSFGEDEVWALFVLFVWLRAFFSLNLTQDSRRNLAVACSRNWNIMQVWKSRIGSTSIPCFCGCYGMLFVMLKLNNCWCICEPMYRGPSRCPCIGSIYPTLLGFGGIQAIILSYPLSNTIPPCVPAKPP